MAVSVIENVQTRESNSAVHSTQKKRTNLMAIFTYRGGGVPHLNSISFIRTMMFYSSQPDAFSLFTFNAANWWYSSWFYQRNWFIGTNR